MVYQSDEIEGKFDQAKGKTKETVGRAINDRELENEARLTISAARSGRAGKVRRKVGETIEDVGDAIKR
jgi:uncharacterized protein YjbJ (UPF0337 family)